MDVVDRTTRSRMMSGIRGRNTRPELALRRALHARGLRYSLHAKGLPGKPDIVFRRRKVALFVHGCFWHRHAGCHWCTTPASNEIFWQAKFERNQARDAEVIAALHAAGWRVGTVWECGLRGADIGLLVDRVEAWIRSGIGDFDSGLVRRRTGSA